MNKRQPASTEHSLYIVGWCCIGALLFVVLLLRITHFDFSRYLFPCGLHTLTGLYCPGCGGTRACIYLLQGKLLRSFLYHPFVLYAAILCGWFMLSQSVDKISRHRIPIGMKYRDIYLWLAIVLVVVNVLIKNLALIMFHTDLLR